MKKQEKKNSKLWLWLAACLVVLLVATGVLLATLIGHGNGPATEPTDGSEETQATEPSDAGTRPDIYWNVDRELYAGKTEAGLSAREPDSDGYYHIVFAYNGAHVELRTQDRQILNRVDGMNLMGLRIDDNDIISEVLSVENVSGGIVAEEFYIENIREDALVCNSSSSLGGRSIELPLTSVTQIYDVAPGVEMVGMIGEPQLSDQIIAIQNRAGEVTHIYLLAHAKPAGDVYWNVTRQWNSSQSKSTRMPDGNGEYSFLLAVNGEQVTLKAKSEAIADDIDRVAAMSFGLQFDEDGYISAVVSGPTVTGGGFFASWYDVLEINGNEITAEKLITASDTGSMAVGRMSADCKVFDVSGTGEFVGMATELRVNDRIHGLTNVQGQVCVIFVVNRLVDSPMYWNLSRQYSSSTASTTRKPNAQGYYEFQLAYNGGNSVFRTRDKEIANQVDSVAACSFGLKVDGDIILKVYGANMVTGGSGSFGSWHDVTAISSTGLVQTYKDPSAGGNDGGTSQAATMAANCKVYDVTVAAEIPGMETELRVGDRIQGWKNARNEIVYIWIVGGRYPDAQIYWNITRKYDSKNAVTTREPENGWYVFEMATNGKQVTLRTKSKEIATKVDSYAASCMGLKVNGTAIEKVYNTADVTGGGALASWFDVEYWTGANKFFTKKYVEPNPGQTAEVTMADNCQVFNVSSAYEAFVGERTTVQVGDRIHCLKNSKGQAAYIFIISRSLKADIYYNVTRMYSSANKETTRTPDGEGWYNILVAGNGVQKTVRTKDKEIASQLDSNVVRIVGLTLNGDEITRVVSAKNVSGYEGDYIGDWGDVMSLSGNKVSIRKNSIASNTGKEWNTTMIADCPVYDVSSTADFIGQKSTLAVGDRVECLSNKNGQISMVFIMTKNTHACGALTDYCEHCDKNVWWEPWDGAGRIENAPTDHYYLTKDASIASQITVGAQDAPADLVICLDGHTLSSEGRAFLVRYGSTLTILDHSSKETEKQGTVSGKGLASSVNNSGVILLTDAGSTLNLYSGNLVLAEDNNPISMAGVINVDAGCTVNLYGGHIAGGDLVSPESTASYAGAINVAGTLNIHDGAIIDGGGAKNGGNLTVRKGGTVNMDGGVISGGTATGGDGGNVLIMGGGSFYLSGGSVEGGSAVNGGSFRLWDDGILSLSGKAAITGGTATGVGGNIYADKGAQITVKDQATVSNGISGTGAANIHLPAAAGTTPHLTLQDSAAVTGGTGAAGFGSVYISGAAAKLTLSGNVKLYDEGQLSLVMGSDTAPIDAMMLQSGARIGLYLNGATEKAFANVSSESVKDCFIFEESAAYTVTCEENAEGQLQLWWRLEGTNLGCECGGKAEGVGDHVCAFVDWVTWDLAKEGRLPGAGGNYILTGDAAEYTVSGTASISDGAVVRLDLNGKIVKVESLTDRVYHITNGELSITDSSDEGTGALVVSGTLNKKGALIGTEGSTNAKIRLYAGTLDASGIKGAGNGAAISLESSACTMDIYGGTIIGGESTGAYGGGTFFINNTKASVTMYDGTIIGGTSTKNGGGAIFILSGNVTMLGGTVQGGTITTDGGSVLIGDTASLVMLGGTVTGGSGKHGGNIRIWDGGKLYIGVDTKGNPSGKDAVLTGGVASGVGGNIYADKHATVIIGGNAVVSDGESVSGADNIEFRGNGAGGVPVLTIKDNAVISLKEGRKDNTTYGSVLVNNTNTTNKTLFTLAGSVRICDEGRTNVVLGSGYAGHIQATELQSEARIGVNLNAAVKAGYIAEVGSASAASCFIFENLDEEENVICEENGNGNLWLRLIRPGEENLCECGGKAVGVEGHVCTVVAWQEWDMAEQGKLPAAPGNYILTGDAAEYTVSGTVSITDGAVVRLDLNGKTVKVANPTDRVYHVTNGELSITDSSEKETGELVVSGTLNKKGVLIGTENSTSVKIRLYAGTLDGSGIKGAGNGAAISLESSACTMDIYGGTIIGGESTGAYGGGTFFINNAKASVTMYDGTVIGGTATKNGGGAILALSGNFTMHGGTVQGGTITTDGGSVLIGDTGSFVILGGTVTGGSAKHGGNIRIWDGGKMYIGMDTKGNPSGKDAVLTGGVASGVGGNIYADKHATVIIGGNAVVSDGESASGADNIEFRGNGAGGVPVLTIKDNAVISLKEGRKDNSTYGSVLVNNTNTTNKTLFTLAGSVRICDEGRTNLVLAGAFAGCIEAEGLTEQARIGITVQGTDLTRAFAKVAGEYAKDCFLSNMEGYHVVYADNRLHLAN